MIQLTDIVKKFDSQIAVDIQSLEANSGEIIGLVGNNGAGKTTLFRIMLDLVEHDKGTVKYMGKDVANSEEWKSYTSSFLNEGFLISYLTPGEYFQFIGATHGASSESVLCELNKYQTFFQESNRKLIRDLSKGNQFKVGILGAILCPPKVLILDEPFANLDPSSQLQLIKILQQLRDSNGTLIFISSHDLNHILELSSRILVMVNGKIIDDIVNSVDAEKEVKKYFNA
jgi:ABC-2 type transport system ATP-binding protein